MAVGDSVAPAFLGLARRRPLGRGINLQIAVACISPLVTALHDGLHPLFMAPETAWYDLGDGFEAGVRQFLVTDPDGCLVCFQESLGRRPNAPAGEPR